MNVDTSGNLLPVPSEGRGIRIEDLACTPGVTKLDVQRVVFTTGAFGSPTENQVHYTISLAFAHFIGTAAFIDAPIATLSNGSPDLSLGQPVRIDKSALGVAITSSIMCSSGIAGLAPRCSGTVFLIGTPVN
jgi:hypothetical protein